MIFYYTITDNFVIANKTHTRTCACINNFRILRELYFNFIANIYAEMLHDRERDNRLPCDKIISCCELSLNICACILTDNY